MHTNDPDFRCPNSCGADDILEIIKQSMTGKYRNEGITKYQKHIGKWKMENEHNASKKQQ
jgi:hypothetical protein